MDAFLSPAVLIAAGTAVLGVAVFGLAPCLPSLFPHWVARLAGFWIAGLSLLTIGVYTQAWKVVGIAAGACVIAMLVIAAHQARPRADASAASSTERSQKSEKQEV